MVVPSSMVRVAPSITCTKPFKRYVLSAVHVVFVVISPVISISEPKLNLVQLCVQSSVPKAPTKDALASKKPSFGGVKPSVKAGEPALGIASGRFKKKGLFNAAASLLS